MVDMLLKRRIRLLPDPSFFNNVMSLISAPKVRPENQPPLSDPKQVSRLEPQTRKPAPKKLWKTLKNFEYPKKTGRKHPHGRSLPDLAETGAA